MIDNNNDHATFPEISISSINCNSLNMSVTSKKNQTRKIYGITKLKTDIILLSDIRLCNKNLVSASNDCAKIFRTKPYCAYKFFFQSSRSKRGVGILFKNDFDVSVEAREADPDSKNAYGSEITCFRIRKILLIFVHFFTKPNTTMLLIIILLVFAIKQFKKAKLNTLLLKKTYNNL